LSEGTKLDTLQSTGEKGTALQQSIFSGAPSSTTKTSNQGLKRGRDEEGEQNDEPMEEDEEDMEMDESDDD
jgi:hypothetical protein